MAAALVMKAAKEVVFLPGYKTEAQEGKLPL
jgi:hypothetical protein